MAMPIPPHDRRISVTGLGYVGLPVAVAFATAGNRVVAFDIDADRIAELRRKFDRTNEVEPEALDTPNLHLTTDSAALRQADFHIVTVPTPVNESRLPDLSMLLAATRTIGKVLKKGDIVVYESTVYPGATEEDCIPLLEAESRLRLGVDFAVGYSPERINPGDREHRFESIIKVVSASDPATLEVVASVYGSVVMAGIHKAASIKVAEAAKVIENTQRDLNIALMNELALIFDRLDIRTRDVLAAARTKWNFIGFYPGLVGGHCIGVDPYYLTARAEAVGYHSEVILSGRRINDGMGAFVAKKLVKLLVQQDLPVSGARVGILGVSFKENVPDLRNSKVLDIIDELRDYGINPLVHDPLVCSKEADERYRLKLSDLDEFREMHALILAVPHRDYLAQGAPMLMKFLLRGGIIIDVKSALDPAELEGVVRYWSL